MKTPKLYDVTYRTDALSLPTIISTLEGVATLVSVRPVDAPATPPRIARRYVSQNGATVKGSDLIIKYLTTAGRPCPADELERHFVSLGLAGHSAAPRLSELVRSGRVYRTDTGRFALVPAPQPR